MKLLLCGDTVPTEASAPLFASGDIDGLFGKILGVFASYDRVFCNLECALTDSEERINKFGPNLKGPIATAQTLKAAGVTDCGLANNHMLDFGVNGMRSTIAALDAAGVHWVGAGENEIDSRKPLIIEADGKKTAILALAEHEYNYALPDQPGATPFDPFDSLTDIYNAKKNNDYVIVVYHGGKEHCRYPSPRLLKACRGMVNLGADVVVCQHSHIVGCYEHYNDGHIVYGTGNFHFVKYRDQQSWSEGLVVGLDIADTLDIRFIPTVQFDTGADLADEASGKAIMDGFWSRSESLQDGTWVEGWREFCDSVAPTYIATVAKAYADPSDPRLLQNFCHYLDCEAHTDVYRELFKTWHADKTDGACPKAECTDKEQE